jgi:hypothetical protein
VVESGALLKRCTSKGYRGFESLPHRCFSDPIRTNPEAYWRPAYFFEGEAWRIFTNHRERKNPFSVCSQRRLYRQRLRPKAIREKSFLPQRAFACRIATKFPTRTIASYSSRSSGVSSPSLHLSAYSSILPCISVSARRRSSDSALCRSRHCPTAASTRSKAICAESTGIIRRIGSLAFRSS